MPVVRAADRPTFDLQGNTIHGLAAPRSGCEETIMYRLVMPSGAETRWWLACPSRRQSSFWAPGSSWSVSSLEGGATGGRPKRVARGEFERARSSDGLHQVPHRAGRRARPQGKGVGARLDQALKSLQSSCAAPG